MTRTELASITMLTREDLTINTLVEAGILTVSEQISQGGRSAKARGMRKRIVVGLNAAFPVYRELRSLLVALADKPKSTSKTFQSHETTTISQHCSKERSSVARLFYQSLLLKALLLMNAVREGELDAASLNRLRPEHAPFRIHGRMHWLLDEGIVTVRPQGLLRYYALNPDYRAHEALKRLIDRIAEVWPEMVVAAAYNDDLKPARRLTQDRDARKRRKKRS